MVTAFAPRRAATKLEEEQRSTSGLSKSRIRLIRVSVLFGYASNDALCSEAKDKLVQGIPWLVGLFHTS